MGARGLICADNEKGISLRVAMSSVLNICHRNDDTGKNQATELRNTLLIPVVRCVSTKHTNKIILGLNICFIDENFDLIKLTVSLLV